MPLISKPNYNQIFASSAPSIDTPPEFANYPSGWAESRVNNGKPTIKQFNYIHQNQDLKALWILQNGGALPYDASIEYADGVLALKDGVLQQINSGVWSAYRNETPYLLKYYTSGVTYPANAEIMLTTGEKVKNASGGNLTNDPNTDMTGWKKTEAITSVESIAELRAINNAKEGDTAYVKSYAAGNNVGGGVFLWDSINTSPDNGVNTFAVTGVTTGRWVRPIDVVITPHHAGAVDGTDSSDALDRFAAFVLSDAGKSLVEVVGNFNISRPWAFNYTGQINSMHWDLELKALNGMRYMIALKGGGIQQSGSIRLAGTGSVGNYSSMTVEYGAVFNGVASSNLPFIRTSLIKYYGVIQDQDGVIGIAGTHNNTTITMNGVSGRDCGCTQGSAYSNHSVSYTYSNPVHTGTSGAASQRTTIDVTGIPYDSGLISNVAFAVINNITYRIESTDFENSKISIFPWIETGEPLTGSIKYIFGGAFYNGGNNSGPTNLKSIDSIRCGIGFHDACLYGATATSITTQFCGVGVLIGGSASSLSPQTSIYIGVYTEAVYRNLVYIGSGSSTIINRYGAFVGEPFVNSERIAANNRTGDYGANADTFGWSRISMPASYPNQLAGQYYKGRANNRNDATASAISLSVNDLLVRTYKRNSSTINLQDNTLSNKTKGLDDALINFIGTGSNNSPTGTFTFNPPSGWTVNGGASAAFTGFSNPAMFACYWEMVTKNIIVKDLNSGLYASATYDPPSLTAGQRDTIQTMTLTGAALGDNVNVSFDKNLQGVGLFGYVSSANTVSYYFENRTSATVDLASGIVKAKII